MVGIILVGYCWYANEGQDNTQNKTKILWNSTVQNETADWNTYINKSYGFAIKYPKENWSLSIGSCITGSDKDCVSISHIGNYDCSIHIANTTKEIYENCKSYKDTKNTTFSGELISLTMWGMSGTPLKYCIQRKNQYFYISETTTYISPHRNPSDPLPPQCQTQDYEILEKILSTYRFLD